MNTFVSEMKAHILIFKKYGLRQNGKFYAKIFQTKVVGDGSSYQRVPLYLTLTLTLKVI